MSISGTPTPPIAIEADPSIVTGHLNASRVEISESNLEALIATGAEVTTADGELVEASRDWWPLAMIWALDGEVAALACVVVRPGDAHQVAAVLKVCNDARLPVTPAAGRSGVCAPSTGCTP